MIFSHMSHDQLALRPAPGRCLRPCAILAALPPGRLLGQPATRQVALRRRRCRHEPRLALQLLVPQLLVLSAPLLQLFVRREVGDDLQRSGRHAHHLRRKPLQARAAERLRADAHLPGVHVELLQPEKSRTFGLEARKAHLNHPKERKKQAKIENRSIQAQRFHQGTLPACRRAQEGRQEPLSP